MTDAEPTYEPKRFWERRLSQHFDLKGVGHIAFSTTYNGWLYRRKRRCIEEFFKNVDLKGKQVLDIGCGTGFFVEWYLRRGAKVTGVDITALAIERLSAKLDANFQVADITDPAFPVRGPFDIVNMWDVIYHIVDQNGFDRALVNIKDCLNPDGLFLFTDWLGLPEDQAIAAHVQARCLATYQRVLPANGLKLLSVRPLYTVLNRHNMNARVDNVMGAIYYFIDNQIRTIARDNLSLGIGQSAVAR